MALVFRKHYMFMKRELWVQNPHFCVLYDCRMQGNILQMKKPSSLNTLAAHSNVEMITECLGNMGTEHERNYD
jgi:hypothetical protein